MATAPLTQRDFSERLDRLGPFETAPHVAVAVSGGADSMALLLLAAAWAANKNGRVTALTVDHGLRAEAAAEVAEVARRCRARGIACETMRWDGDKPATRIQEAARSARYDLMTGWCRDRAVAHLMVAHHAGDQAETFLYRMGRGSGADGLAGMPAAVVRAGVRLLRPLLDVAPERLRAVLDAEGETWLDDPSNRDGRFARVAVRRRIEALGDRGFGLAVFGEATAALGAARAERDRARSRLAAGAVALYPEGYAEIALDALCRADADSARDLLAVVLHTIGGAHYAPRRARLGRLADDVLTGDFRRARTLGGCAIVPDGGGSLRIWREPRAATETVPLRAAPKSAGTAVLPSRSPRRPAGGRACVSRGSARPAGNPLQKARIRGFPALFRGPSGSRCRRCGTGTRLRKCRIWDIAKNTRARRSWNRRFFARIRCSRQCRFGLFNGLAALSTMDNMSTQSPVPANDRFLSGTKT